MIHSWDGGTNCFQCPGAIECYGECTCQMPANLLYTGVLFNVLHALAMCITGAILSKDIYSEQRMSKIANGDDFDGLCNCWSERQICLCGFFCPAIRAAQTYHNASVGEYLPCLCLIGSFYALPLDIGGLLVFLVLFVKRGELRQRGIPGLRENACMDCLCTFFCQDCVICQEARFVEAAKRKSGTIGMAQVNPPVADCLVGKPVEVVQFEESVI